jgi:cysteinyl-tRNA synthetase
MVRDNGVEPGQALEAAFAMDTVLGLNLKAGLEIQGGEPENADLADAVEKRIAERGEAKKAKDFARADAIRQELKDKGIILEDGPDGTRWRRA